jgi:hypothetical protein
MAVPKPRREGQRGGMNHRSNHGAFRASGGNVKPPKKGGCLALFLLFMTVPGTFFGMIYHHFA